jgi:hypothetical protein
VNAPAHDLPAVADDGEGAPSSDTSIAEKP